MSSPSALHAVYNALRAGAAVLVDVREVNEWLETGVPEPAILLSLSEFTNDSGHGRWSAFLQSVGDKELVLICRSGARAGRVAAGLVERGYKGVIKNIGGFDGWKNAGLPVRRATREEVGR